MRVGQNKKGSDHCSDPSTWCGSNAEIIDLFGEEPKILASFTKDTSTNYQEGLLELYKKIRPASRLQLRAREPYQCNVL